MIRHIALIDSQRGLAKDGDQPAHLKTDQAYFREKTMSSGGNVLMGRTTFDVIGVLKGRQNFVASHHLKASNDVTVVPDVATFLREFKEDVWIIGGAAIFSLTLQYADELYITKMEHDFGCDQFYPQYQEMFTLISTSEPLTEENIRYRFYVYRRKLT